MKNIHVLNTDKLSRLFSILQFNYVFDKDNNYSEVYKKVHGYKNQHVFITSDEEIKEGDIFIHPNGTIERASRSLDGRGISKIILTTDQDLIADGVQSISNDFLEWFVDNPNCMMVEVEEIKCTGQCWKFIESDYEDTCLSGCELKGEYKIIIPKEELKQETIEIKIKSK
ncbi:MAG: hypothetical protein ACOVNU_11645 [Candidatus Kapaibacteriota bacterium]